MNRAVPVRPEDKVHFHCRRCANCCRNLEDQLMLEPLDAYRLASFLHERGEASTIDDVYERYTHTDLLEGGLPIYLMNTVGPDNSCVFLQDGRCSAYDGRPNVCRIYPFSVRPGQRGQTFEFYRCVDQHAAHFSGSQVQVKDWLCENFTRESREFWTAEGNFLPILGSLLRGLGNDGVKANLFYILHYRYYSYDLDRPFMPQYTSNMAALKYILQKELGEV
jgi:Fe-S-cluster containining protein